jgi:hypothetical protein
MSTVNDCGHGGKGDGIGAPPEQWQGHGGGGEETPSEPVSMMKRRMNMERWGEVTLPPHSLPHEDLPSLGDIFSRQVGISIGVHQLKHS